MKPNRRPYDVAMDDSFRFLTHKRRENPDGVERQVTRARRSGVTINKYPWDEMLLGDYFYVHLGNNRREAFDVRIRQVALRRNWEITTKAWEMADGSPGVRVALTCLDVDKLKMKAKVHHGKEIKVTDGKWSETRKARYRAKRALPTPRPGKLIKKPAAPQETALPVDVAIATAPPDPTGLPGYDRAAVMRERLAKLADA